MQWRDDGIVVSVRRHGETSAIVDLLTSVRGRHSGLVRGASSAPKRAILQIGNHVDAVWRGRLDEHLGFYTLESKQMRASRWMDEGYSLFALQTLAAYIRLLPPREESPRIYSALCEILDSQISLRKVGEQVVRFELLLLEQLGFGLDLRSCASTGKTDDLIYVSPRSGQAVSRDAGAPYIDRLLPLPKFLFSDDSELSISLFDIYTGLDLTGFFLQRRIYDSRPEHTLPTERESLYKILKNTKDE